MISTTCPHAPVTLTQFTPQSAWHLAFHAKRRNKSYMPIFGDIHALHWSGNNERYVRKKRPLWRVANAALARGEDNSMQLTLGCKSWSCGRQIGFRVYADDIITLVPMLNLPSIDASWDTLADFYNAVRSGTRPTAYSRRLVVFDGSRSIEATATLAKHGRTVQGYITAAHGSWLYDYVQRNMGLDLDCEYIVQDPKDLVMIPRRGDTVR